MTDDAPFVRRLGSDDLGFVRALNALFGRAFAEPNTYEGAPPADAWLAEALAKPHIMALGAFAGDELVGGLVAYELEKLERARREIYIYDLAVDAAFRRRGVATALVRHVGTIAAARGARAVFVQADHGDDPAMALYEKLGIREDVVHFDIAVPATGD